MIGKRKRRTLKRLFGVTCPAITALISILFELAEVGIVMALPAIRRRAVEDLHLRRLPQGIRNLLLAMAFLAGDLCMATLKRKPSLCMVGEGELRRRKCIFCVTGQTVCTANIGDLRFPAMRVAMASPAIRRRSGELMDRPLPHHAHRGSRESACDRLDIGVFDGRLAGGIPSRRDVQRTATKV